MLNLEYFYENEAEQFTFFRIPKVLFTDKRFKNLSTDAKVLYGLMLDRMGLSVKNRFSAIKAIGFILLGFGVVQIGLSLKSHDASQRANGFLTFFGGVISHLRKIFWI